MLANEFSEVRVECTWGLNEFCKHFVKEKKHGE